MAISVVQFKGGSTTSAASVTINLGTAVTPGNALIATVTGGGASVTTITGGGTGWGSASGVFNSDIGFAAIWALQDVTTAGTAIVVTQNAANVMGVYVYEVSGLVTTGAVDKVSSQAQDTAGTIYNSGTTATTTVANEFWVGMAGGYGLDFTTSYPVLTAPAGFTVQPQQNIVTAIFHNSGYEIASSTGAAVYSGTDTNHTADTGMNVVAAVATFKGATSTGITSTGTMVGAPGVFTAFTPAGPITSTGTMVEVTGVMAGVITPPTITTTGTMVGAPQVMAGTPPNTNNPSWDPTGSYTLILNEDFLGSSLDTSIWTLGWQATSGISGPINAATDPGVDGEAAAYNSNHVVVADSILSLQLTETSVVSGGVTYPYTGSCITSNPATLGGSNGFQFTGGAVEFYANLPGGTVGSATVIANWPALWIDGQSWPTDGEIDVMEGLGGTVQWHCWSTLNDPGVGSAAPNQGDGTDTPYFSDYANSWHTYGCSWDPTGSPSQIDWYYDGVLVGTLQSGTNFDTPMYLILNNTTGWQSGPEVAPATVQVDWVKVWQPASTPATVPPVANLADNFSSASTLQTLWCASGNVSISGGQASIATDPNYDGFLLSGTSYNLTGGTYFEKVTLPTGTIEGGMSLTDQTQNGSEDGSAYNTIDFYYDGTDLNMSITQAGVVTSIASVAYSATNHAWWRIAESGGTITWYTSANGTSWSSQGSHAHTLQTTALFAYTWAGNDGSGTLATLVDNVNGGAAAVTTSGGMAGSPGSFFGSASQPIPSVSTSGGLQGFVETMAGSATVAGPVFTTSGGMAAQPFAFQGVTSANNSNSATLTVTPSFSATPSRGQPSSAALTITPNLGSFILDESGSSLDDEGGSNIWDQQGAASATVTHPQTASLTVTPNFTAVAKHGNVRQATLTVTPNQTVTTLRVQVDTATLTVTPVFVVNTNHNNNHNTGGSLTVTPTFIVTTTHGYFRTASLTETPAFTATGLHTQFRTATLTATPAFTNSRQLTQVSSGSLTVTPAFSATGLRTQFQTASLTVIPAFDAERQITQVFSASLAVIPSFAVTRVYTHNVTATVEIPLGQFPATVHGHFPSASLEVDPQLTVIDQKTGQGHADTASVTVTPSITPAGVRHVQFRTAALTVTPNVPNASSTHGRFRTATLTVTPSGSATPLHTQYQTASLEVDPQFTVITQFAQVDTASLTTSPVFLTNFSHNGANHNSAVASLTVTPVLPLVSRLHGHNPTATLTVTPARTSTYQHTQFRTASVTATPVISNAGVLHTQYTSASVTVTPRRFTNRIRTGFSSGNLVITPEFGSTQQFAQVAQALLEVDPMFTVTLEGGSITGTVEFILGQPFFEWTTGPVRT